MFPVTYSRMSFPRDTQRNYSPIDRESTERPKKSFSPSASWWTSESIRVTHISMSSQQTATPDRESIPAWRTHKHLLHWEVSHTSVKLLSPIHSAPSKTASSQGKTEWPECLVRGLYPSPFHPPGGVTSLITTDLAINYIVLLISLPWLWSSPHSAS